MKVSQEEIDAGAKAYCQNRFANGDKAIVWNDAIQSAIEAAYRVRKQRKKARREKAVTNGESEFLQSLPDMWVDFLKPEYKATALALKATKSTATPKPFTGPFEAGKSYRTRDGRKADIIGISDYSGARYTVTGWVGDKFLSWTDSGASYVDEISSSDLIAPWVEPS